MFRRHTAHLQSNFLATVEQLSETRQQRLSDSWAGTFYREVFCRIDETLFADLYKDTPSRPNTPINQLVSLEILKSGYNWSDEELFDHLNFDLQVRYALGVRDLEAEICTPRTVYNFRRRVSHHMRTTGKNLFEAAFAQVTDEQCQALALDTQRQRMDSTQVGSQIRAYSRLRLLIEVLQRATRMLPPTDPTRNTATLAPYLQSKAGQYCYRVRAGTYTQELAQVGRVIAHMLTLWAADYATQAAYQLLERVFHEHFTVADPQTPLEIEVKPPRDLSAASLQAPDDSEATYRQKNGQDYHGYVANVTETCTPDNPVQLITHIQVAANNTDDQDLLVAAVPEIKNRMAFTDLDIDGGYIGPATTQIAREHQVTLHPTAIRGAKPQPDKIGLAQFTWACESGTPVQVTCPHAQTVTLHPGRTAGRYLAYFEAAICATCPHRDKCPTHQLKRRPGQVLRVTQRQIEVAALRHACAATALGPPYLRPAVEATVRSLKHPFGARLPVRGITRMTAMLCAAGFMVNLRRIWRYQQAKRLLHPLKNIAAASNALLLQWRSRLNHGLQLAARSINHGNAVVRC